ncbi:MAG TPA: YggS family pyridoxal phosphate-dependent enzyme [Pyrinomonadaceae bacterium]|nr:YggS family pyridoxal phosphate-dependent enzyme [Pyrinomonadaceae bacterium]
MLAVNTANSLIERIAEVRARLTAAADRSDRSVDEITLVAVSKTRPAEAVREAITAGVNDFGENRVQEAESKIPAVGRTAARWHLIGHLQSNKARRAVELFDCIHSLDSLDLAKRLNRICDELDRPELPLLIQVDLGHEATKMGIEEKGMSELVAVLRDCPRLRLTGLMTLPPFFDEAEKVRPYFRRLRELRDDLKAQGAFGDHPGELSMGMTHDFEIAIQEGATMVRVGTAIFGERGK